MENNNEFGSQILNSIRQQIDSRLASPLIGSFAISWAIVNYKFILILLSDNSVSQKMFLIETVAYPNKIDLALDSFLTPLVISLFYIFILPLPEKIIFRYTRTRQKEITAIQNEIEGNELLTREQSRELRLSARRIEQNYKERIGKLVEEIGERDRMIGSLEEEVKKSRELASNVEFIGELESPPDVSTKDGEDKNESPVTAIIAAVELAILKVLSDNRAHTFPSLQMDLTGFSGIRVQVAIDSLVRRGLVKHAYNENEDSLYFLTDLGRIEVIAAGFA